MDGTRYDLITEDLIDFRTAYFGGPTTLGVVDFLDARIRPPRTVLWDVGANVGSIFLPLARRHPELLIEAFEPAPPVIARLRGTWLSTRTWRRGSGCTTWPCTITSLTST